MPAPLNVNREAVQMLAKEVGVREAARQMGLPEATVQAWSARGDWFTPKELPPTMIATATTATKASDALEQVMQERHGNTRLGLSRYVERMATQAAESKELADASKLKDVADIMGKVWPEQSGPSTAIQVNIMQLGLRGEE